MSVTIYPTQSGTLRRFRTERTTAPCSACAANICQPGWCIDGIETIETPTAPEIDLSNDNARTLLRCVGLDPGEDLCGALAADEIAALVVEVDTATGVDSVALFARSGMLRAGSRDGNCLMPELTDSYAIGRLARLRVVLDWALASGAGVAWQ